MKRKISQLSMVALKTAKKKGYRYMVRNTEEYGGGLVLFKAKPLKIKEKGAWMDPELEEIPYFIEDALREDMLGLRGLEFIRWEDEEPWEIDRLMEITEMIPFNLADAVETGIILENMQPRSEEKQG